jgi:hypothetical protein
MVVEVLLDGSEVEGALLNGAGAEAEEILASSFVLGVWLGEDMMI